MGSHWRFVYNNLIHRHTGEMERSNMEDKNKKKVPFLLWPFWLIWKLVAIILELTGRLLGAILGMVVIILGIVLCATVIGAILGIPLIILGFMLMIRSIF